MNNCKCGGHAKLVGTFLVGYRVECQKCGKHTKPLDKVGAIKSWEVHKIGANTNA
jgi:hypothetical protein